MSTISSVSSLYNLYASTPANSFGQSVKDFKAIGDALQSGDLATAQNSLTSFLQASSSNSASSSQSPFGKNSQANSDFQGLVSALNSNDLTAAQKAYENLRADLKAAHQSHHHHHSSPGAPTAAATTPAPASSTVTGTDGENDGGTLNTTA